MPYLIRRASLALCALLTSAPALAAEVTTLGGRLDLPFAGEVEGRSVSRELGRTFTTSEQQKFILAAPVGEARHGLVLVHLVTPEFSNPGFVGQVIEDILESEREKGAQLSRRDVEVSGFPFQLVVTDLAKLRAARDAEEANDEADEDAFDPDEGPPPARSVRLIGTLNGSMLTVSVNLPTDAALEAAAAQALAAMTLDLPQLLQQRLAFDVDAGAAVSPTRMATPFGDLPLTDGLQARLTYTESYDSPDQLRNRTVQHFLVTRSGFWSTQYVALGFTCAAGEALDADERRKIHEAILDPRSFTRVEPAATERIGGREVERRGARHRLGRVTTDYLQWLATGEREIYRITLDSLGGKRLLRTLRPEIGKLTLQCPPRLQASVAP